MKRIIGNVRGFCLTEMWRQEFIFVILKQGVLSSQKSWLFISILFFYQ
jgi:hypothetical protein